MKLSQLEKRILWSRENGDPDEGRPCSWCHEQVEECETGLECVSCGEAAIQCGVRISAEERPCCGECDHTEPIVPILIWRNNGREMATFHPECFNALLELGVLTMSRPTQRRHACNHKT